MDDYPSNSRSRELPKKNEPKPVAKKPEKAEKVIVGQAKIRKTPIHRKLTQTFVKGSLSEVAERVFWTVAVPAAKDLIADSMNDMTNGMLFGDGSSRRSSRGRSSGHTNYSRYSSSNSEPRERESRVRKDASLDFGELILQSRAEAEMILDRMSEYLEEFGVVTVADMYDFAGESRISNYTDRNWGWTSLAEARLERLRGGEITINLPRPSHIK